MHIRLVAATLILLPLAACSPGNRDLACRPLRQPPAASTPAAASPFKGTVFTIVMENKSSDDVMKTPDAPYLQSLAHKYAFAASYTDALVHPSEPNYIWMAAGENFGVLDDDSPASHHLDTTSHIADQIEKAGLDWRSYQESMGTPCKLDATYPYDPKHNPFVYFNDVNGWNGTAFAPSPRCTQHVVDYSQFDADLASGRLPSYVFITPNLIDDMHDGSIAQGDQWLSREVPKILDSPAWKNGGVLFLTWDEGSLQGDDVAMIVISPLAKPGYVSLASYDTSSYLKTVQRILGLEPLPCDPNPDSVATMDDMFTVPLPAAVTPAATTSDAGASPDQ